MKREERIQSLWGSLEDLERVMETLKDAQKYQKREHIRDSLIQHGAEQLADFMDRYLGPCLYD